MKFVEVWLFCFALSRTWKRTRKHHYEESVFKLLPPGSEGRDEPERWSMGQETTGRKQ